MAQNDDETAELHPRRDLGFFELGFHPEPSLISTVRRFVAALYGRLIPDCEGVERVALAVHELLENAVKYSQGGDTGLRVEVFERGSQLVVCIRTRNRADETNREVLRGILQELSRVGDPYEAYQAAMKGSLEQGDASRIGLARVRAEAGMRLAIEEGVDGELTLVASTEVQLGPRP